MPLRIVCSEVREGACVSEGRIGVGDWAGTRVSNYRDWADRQLVALGADRLEAGEPRRGWFRLKEEFPWPGLHLFRRKNTEGWEEAEAL